MQKYLNTNCHLSTDSYTQHSKGGGTRAVTR